MLQRLPITLAQVKEGNSSENSVNEICRIISTRKKIAKKVLMYYNTEWIQFLWTLQIDKDLIVIYYY